MITVPQLTPQRCQMPDLVVATSPGRQSFTPCSSLYRSLSILKSLYTQMNVFLCVLMLRGAIKSLQSSILLPECPVYLCVKRQKIFWKFHASENEWLVFLHCGCGSAS